MKWAFSFGVIHFGESCRVLMGEGTCDDCMACGHNKPGSHFTNDVISAGS